MTPEPQKAGVLAGRSLQQPNKGGRPFLGPTEVIAIRVPKETADLIRRRAEAAGRSMNDYLKEVVFRNEFTRRHRSREWQRQHRRQG